MSKKIQGNLSYKGIHRSVLEHFILLAESADASVPHTSAYRKLTNAFLTHLTGKLNAITELSLKSEFCSKQSWSDNSSDMWLTSVSATDYLSALHKYPELRELIDTIVKQELANLSLAAHSLKVDLHRLINTGLLPVGGVDEISHIFVLTGESHDCGKNVVLFYTNGKPAFAWKPRNIDIEARTSDFIKAKVTLWLGDSEWVFPTYLTSDAWGWTSWHVPQNCRYQSDIANYFLRIGTFSAFSAALGITDLNAENIIPNGASPVFVDLETVLHHELDGPNARWGVLSTGLFPTSLRYWDSADLTETSGLVGSLEPPRDINGNRAISPEKAYLIWDGKIQRPIDHSQSIIDGFKRAAYEISEHKADIFGFINECKNLPTRCILRPTAGYQTIIEQSVHPSLLAEKSSRTTYIERCLTYAHGNLGNPTLITAEATACAAADVPRFTGTPAAPLIRSGYHTDAIVLENIRLGYDKSSAYLTKLNVDKVGSEALAISEFMTHLNFLVTAVAPQDITNSRDAAKQRLHELKQRLLFLVDRSIDEDFEMHAFRKASYIGYMYEPMKIDLFSGLAALAFFAATTSHEFRADDLCAFSESFSRRLKTATATEQLVGGAYVGLCSTVLPLIHLRHAINSHLFHETLEKLLAKIERSAFDPNSFLGTDLVGGTSGALAVCVLAWGVTADQRWLDVAGRLYQALISRSQLQDGIRYFPSAPGVSAHPLGSLSGLSHGQAGIAYALSLYWRACAACDSAVAETVLQTFRFEIHNYDQSLCGWRDYRAHLPHRSNFNFSWAYGIPGVILAAREIGNNSEYSEIRRFADGLPFQSLVLKVLSDQISDNDDSLATGAIGTLAIARRIMPTEYFRLLEDIVRKSALFCRPCLDGLPGLMTGIMGRHLGVACIEGADWTRIPLLPHELCHDHAPDHAGPNKRNHDISWRSH